MLDTYDSLEWDSEKNDNEDEDVAVVIGACDSDKEAEDAGSF